MEIFTYIYYMFVARNVYSPANNQTVRILVHFKKFCLIITVRSVRISSVF